MTITASKPSRITATLGVSFATIALAIAIAGAWIIQPAASNQPRIANTASVR